MTDALAHVLAEFRDFLIRRRCVPERQLPFFLSWTQRFLEFAAARPPGPFEDCRLAYLEDLRRDRTSGRCRTTWATRTSKRR